MSLYVNPDSVVDFTTDSEYWIYRLITDAEKHPGEIRILEMPLCQTNILTSVKNKFNYSEEIWNGRKPEDRCPVS